MEESVKNKVKLIKSTQITEILATCAFGFALISFLSTAIGLNQFAFEDSAWRGFLLSFCIQSILLTLNLNMPKFLSSVTVGWKITIILFYATLLSISSFFSFVFITNLSYEKTYYVDTQAIIEKAIVKELLDSKSAVKSALDEKSTEIYNKLHELDRGKVVPHLPKLTFTYNIKELMPLVPNATLEPGKDRVFISSDASWVLNYLWFPHEELHSTKTSLNEILSEINKLNRDVENLSQKNINTEIPELRRVLDSVEQYITRIGHYNDTISSIEKKIDGISDNQKLEDEGANNFLADLETQYYEKQKNDIREISVLIRDDTDKNGAGYLRLLHKELTTILNSENVLALFIEATSELRDEGSEITARERLYDAVKFASNNQDNVIGKWTYQQFDVSYLSYETLFKIDAELNLLHESINQIGLVTNPTADEIAEYANKLPNDNKVPNENNPSNNEMPDENEIATLLLEARRTEWRDDWSEIIASFHKILLQISSLIDATKEYSAVSSSERLIDLFRTNLSDMSAVENAISKFTSEYPGKAIFAALFSLFMDMASLIVGLMVYLRTDSYQERKQPKEEK